MTAMPEAELSSCIVEVVCYGRYDAFGRYHDVPFLIAAACALMGSLLYYLAHQLSYGSAEALAAEEKIATQVRQSTLSSAVA